MTGPLALTRTQAAASLQISVRTLDDRIARGKIVAKKDGGIVRIAPQALRDYLDADRDGRVASIVQSATGQA